MSRFLRSQPPQPELRAPIGLSPLAKVTTPGQLRVATTCAAVRQSRRFSLRHTTSFFIETPLALARPLAPPTAIHLAARTRESIKRRFPLQGWEGQETIKTGGVGTVAPTPFNKYGVSPVAFGGTSREQIATSFIPLANATATTATIWLKKVASPTDNVVVAIQADAAGFPSGIDLGTASVSGAGLTSTLAPVDFSGFSVPLSAGTTYWVIARRDGAIDGVNLYDFDAFTVNDSYLGAFFRTALGWSAIANGSQSLWFSLVTAGDNLGVFARNLGPRPPLFIDPAQRSPVDTTLAVLSTAVVQRAQFVRHGPKSLLFPPATLAQPPPLPPPVAVTLAARQTRADQQRRFPLQGWEETPVTVIANPFSSTSILDTFIRPDENPLSGGGNWANAWTALTGHLAIVSNAVLSPLGAIAVSYWTRFQFGDSEAYASQNFSAAVKLGVWARVTPGVDASGYRAQWNGSVVTLSRMDSGSATSLGSVSVVRASGDKLAIRCLGSTIQAWVNQGGVWTLKISAADATYATGYIGLETDANGAAGTPHDFGGGFTSVSTMSLVSRFLGPRPPLIVAPLVPQVTTIDTSYAVANQKARRAPLVKSLLFPPQTLANPPPPLSGPAVNCLQPDRLSRRFRRQLPSSVLSPPIVTATFIAPALSANCLSPDRLARRFRRQLPTTALQPPTVLRVFAAGRPALVHSHPRPIIHRLAPPTVVRIPSVEQREQTIAVSLSRIRPRPIRSVLTKTVVAVVVTFVARPVSVALAHTRPRPTSKALRPPTVLRVPSVEQREQTIQVSLVHTRPRHTLPSLPETIVTAAAFTAEPITVALSRVRPRRATSFLVRPVTLSTFSGPLVATVKTRPRLTTAKLNEPSVVRIPSVEQQEDTVRVSLTRTRPRPTVKLLAGPTTLREFVGPQVTTVRTKPRPTVTRLGEPTVVRVPSVEQQEQTIRVALVQTKPRPTTKRLSPPRVVRVPSVEQAEQTVRSALIHTRPRPTVTRLEAPAVVRRPAVGSIATTLVGVKTRRDMSHQFSLQSARQRIVRETGSTVTYQQRDPFIGPRPPQIIDPLPTQRVQTIGVYEPRIKPRPTRTKLSAPTRINPLPTLRMQTVQVALVRTRPRKTVQVLAEPTTVAAGFFAEPITVTQTRIRPRPTIKALYEPTVVRVPSVEQQEDTIRVSLVRTRPRPTTRLLGKPVALRVFDGASTATVVTRPRPTSYTLREPVVLRQVVFYGPLVVLVRTRPRPTTKELTPPTVVTRATFSGPEVFTVKTRPRPTVKALGEPTVVRVPSIEQLRRTILVTLTRTRPRHVAQTLRLPTVLRTFVGPRVTLVKSRPRPTTRRLSPPTRLLIQSVFQAQQTIRVKFVQTRPRPTTRRLAPPTKLAVQAVFQKQQTIRTALVQTRPQPTTTTLSPPTIVAVASVFQAQQTVRVGLTRIVPPPTVPLLRAPEVIATTTRAVATTNPSHPNEATTSATEQTEASLSSGRTDTIARVSESEATEATVSESEATEAETEAT